MLKENEGELEREVVDRIDKLILKRAERVNTRVEGISDLI